MIPMWCPFGLIQKDEKIKTDAAGPDLRCGPLENLKLAPSSLRQQIFLMRPSTSVRDGPPAKVGFFSPFAPRPSLSALLLSAKL